MYFIKAAKKKDARLADTLCTNQVNSDNQITCYWGTISRITVLL